MADENPQYIAYQKKLKELDVVLKGLSTDMVKSLLNDTLRGADSLSTYLATNSNISSTVSETGN
jgi:hypothetical protein